MFRYIFIINNCIDKNTFLCKKSLLLVFKKFEIDNADF